MTKNNYSAMEILLVEDSVNDVTLTLRAFKKNNLANKVFTVSDGEEALEFLFSTGRYADRNVKVTPKIVLLDLKLPKINGIEVLRKIKTDERTRSIPVVVLTSSQETSDLNECYRLGVNSYIQKPVDFDQFVKVLTDAGMYWMAINKLPS